MSRPAGLAQPVVTGLVTSLVGFTSAFTIVLAGLRGVGASDRQAASGLLVLCLVTGLLAVLVSARTRMPVSIAWSTPGAALLAGTGHVDGGWPAAVGAFAACGVLLALTGLFSGLGRLLARIPAPLASAMLAGILLELCLAPVRAVVALPALALPVVATWAILRRLRPLWAVPAALVVAVVAVLIDQPVRLGPLEGLLPHAVLTVPQFTPGALIGVALPLFIVTMASQNIPGVSVLASFGYHPALRPVLVATGAATVACAPFGGHAVNLAAITAALPAGPEAHPDPTRRWIATAASGCGYALLGLGAGLATAFVAAAPPVIIAAVAGLALVGALAGALQSAMASPAHREAATVTLVVGASGITVAGIGASFWALLAGLAFLGLQRARS